MHASTRTASALLVALLCLLLAASSAVAGTPATVTVRVLGANYEPLIPLTQINTTSTPVVNDGKPEHACSGTSAAGALQVATAGLWTGGWFESEGTTGYFVETIKGFEPPPASSFWSFWLNNSESQVGICGAELEAGSQVLFFPECFSECPYTSEQLRVLGLEVAPVAEVGKSLAVTVDRYNTAGKREPAAGVTVQGGGTSAETNSEGRATLTFAGAGTYTLLATAHGEGLAVVPGEAVVCAHNGNDGTCGTSVPISGAPPQLPSSKITLGVAYTGPYSLVAAATGIRDGHVYSAKNAPRELAGKVSSHASVTSISLRLRRSYRGRCWAYNGSRARLQRVPCRQGSFFKIASGGDSFSYLLPSRLPAGRYVLDIQATDSAGNHTALARGSSRVVFYVE